MKMVYTNENRFNVVNAQNVLGLEGIETQLKNEYASGAVGELSPFDAWVELWVLIDSDRDRAAKIIDDFFRLGSSKPWVCDHCSEANEATFEFCWNCQSEP